MSVAPLPAEHRVHGMGTALEAPVWPVITAAEAQDVLARFAQAGPFGGLNWHSPRPFSAAVLLDAGDETLFLKRHHRSVRTPAALAEEHAFMAHIGARGVVVPQVLRTPDGAGAIGHGEWTYELHRRAPGIDLYRERQSWTPFLASSHAFEAGAALARLHIAARDFTAPARGGHPLVASFTIVPANDPMAAAEAYIAGRPALASYLNGKRWRPELARLFATLGQGLAERLQGLPALWTHNDWHPSNLLWHPDGAVSAVMDFGLSTRTCALHDLATAIERTAISWLEPIERTGDCSAARAILTGYRSVLPLSPEEIAIIVRLLPLVHIEFALSEADYFAGVLSDKMQADLAWHDYLIGHAEWFMYLTGKEFLGQIEAAA
ncbi:phosphotransferase enzyme family protein [Novosphingobium guangzhouense]|uniref:Aminoglycoside phosphotransferase n=1 Tax=Novosphingobium guangzhouense TaxID=1850347 RepID=A0A2K2G6P3_9SPHN|nr:phosphotransferase [Novosphingobium guangzhouense]PNU06648.1 aminoglycoside phosphotransferase [Novosphingobium guangzhouense]